MENQQIAEATALWRAGNHGHSDVQPSLEVLLQWLVSQVNAEREKSRLEQDQFGVEVLNALVKIHESWLRLQSDVDEGRRATAGVLKVLDDAVCRLYPEMAQKILKARNLHFVSKSPAEVVEIPKSSE